MILLQRWWPDEVITDCKNDALLSAVVVLFQKELVLLGTKNNQWADVCYDNQPANPKSGGSL